MRIHPQSLQDLCHTKKETSFLLTNGNSKISKEDSTARLLFWRSHTSTVQVTEIHAKILFWYIYLLLPSKWQHKSQAQDIWKMGHHHFTWWSLQTRNHRRSQGDQRGHGPPKIFENIVILCFERRFSKQNSVIRLKSNILVPPNSPPNFWAGYATVGNHWFN